MEKTDAKKILALKPEGKGREGKGREGRNNLEDSRRWIIISNWMCAEREWLRVESSTCS
jgi:hypothetical protein